MKSAIFLANTAIKLHEPTDTPEPERPLHSSENKRAGAI